MATGLLLENTTSIYYESCACAHRLGHATLGFEEEEGNDGRWMVLHEKTNEWLDRWMGRHINDRPEGRHSAQAWMCVCASLLLLSDTCECRCGGGVPPQALLAVEIEGVLCTAGMKAGWRSNRSLFRLGTLRSERVEKRETGGKRKMMRGEWDQKWEREERKKTWERKRRKSK